MNETYVNMATAIKFRQSKNTMKQAFAQAMNGSSTPNGMTTPQTSHTLHITYTNRWNYISSIA